MSYYQQPSQRQYDSLDFQAHRGQNMTGATTMRKSIDCLDIEGAAPAKIPGYTGARSYRKLTKNGSMPNFGPTKAEIDNQWKRSLKAAKIPNPSSYKYDFSAKPHENSESLMPKTTDAQIIKSQAFYKSKPRSKRMKQRSKPSLDDTFARLEDDLKVKMDESLKQDAAKFYLQTPIGQKPPPPQNLHQNLTAPEPVRGEKVSEKYLPDPAKEGSICGSRGSAPSYPNYDSHSIAEMYSDQAYKPKIGLGYEEGRGFYENLHARRSKGLPPVTELATKHLEIESNIHNRNNNDYGKFDHYATLGQATTKQINHSRRSYNPLTNEMLDFK
ncbi:unnamed protein product [Moneuplotes crassus]|uniref:Uncharacterized protein n=1 Tax=Euplotes crassus TaxID=5936 RepID=A0AAD2CZ70_EUPCR|nr:unnamed protein product [Moneuplotes crassus]